MNDILLILLGVAVFVVVFGGLGALAILWWVARGESDVNGDPERDSLTVNYSLPLTLCPQCKRTTVEGKCSHCGANTSTDRELAIRLWIRRFFALNPPSSAIGGQR